MTRIRKTLSKHRLGTPLIDAAAFALACGLASLGAPALAQSADTVATQDATRNATVDRAIEADRVYSFVDPKTGHITALAIADDRPAVAIVVDRAAQSVFVASADEAPTRIAIAELADAYAQGDAERRAAFLAALQRTEAVDARASESVCETDACDTPPDDAPTMRLSSIVRWAVDHVGSRRDIAPISDETADTRRIDLLDDPIRAGAETLNVLQAVRHFWRIWH